MKKHTLLCLGLLLSLTTSSLAQFSVGAMVGASYRWERVENLFPSTLGGVTKAQSPVMLGIYGQFVSKGKTGLVAGLQLRYQSMRQSQRFAIPTEPELSDPQYNRYNYLVVTPYVGIRVFNKLEVTAGPEIHALLDSRLVSFYRNPTKAIFGYNLKATYWFSRFGVEGGYSRQLTAYDNQGQLDGQIGYRFYSNYTYGAVKYALFVK